ncbi:MAG: hypothetical protein ACK2UK_00660, partial [Candidatus Promineifilaceae bacterium]
MYNIGCLAERQLCWKLQPRFFVVRHPPGEHLLFVPEHAEFSLPGGNGELGKEDLAYAGALHERPGLQYGQMAY